MLPGDTLPLEVYGISQLLPFCVLATTLKLMMFCPVALMVTGMVDGFACAAPVAAEKFSDCGFALSSVNPPTFMVTITVVGGAPLPCGVMLKEVSYVPGPNPTALAVTMIGVADPAIRFSEPDGLVVSHEAVFAAPMFTVPEPLAVT